MFGIQLLTIGTTEILIIAACILLLFGGAKIPGLMRSLGQGVKSFKQGMNEPLESEKKEENETQTKDQ